MYMHALVDMSDISPVVPERHTFCIIIYRPTRNLQYSQHRQVGYISIRERE